MKNIEKLKLQQLQQLIRSFLAYSSESHYPNFFAKHMSLRKVGNYHIPLAKLLNGHPQGPHKHSEVASLQEYRADVEHPPNSLQYHHCKVKRNGNQLGTKQLFTKENLNY